MTSSDSRPMPPKPRAAPSVPSSAKANAIALELTPKPKDTNGNGFPDLIQVMAYLFSTPHPSPLYEDGAFVFRLYVRGRSDVPDAEPICEWRVEGDDLERAKMGRNLVGPAYGFSLSLLDSGTDKYPPMTVDLRCTFEPADGRAAVSPQGVYSMQIGSRLASR